MYSLFKIDCRLVVMAPVEVVAAVAGATLVYVIKQASSCRAEKLLFLAAAGIYFVVYRIRFRPPPQNNGKKQQKCASSSSIRLRNIETLQRKCDARVVEHLSSMCARSVYYAVYT